MIHGKAKVRIYDSNNYTLRTNLEINQDTRKNYIKVDPKRNPKQRYF